MDMNTLKLFFRAIKIVDKIKNAVQFIKAAVS